MNSYRELEIYKESKRLAIEVHAMTLQLPKFEMYEEGGQVRRSSKSVTSMIVEGYGRRRYKAEYIRYLVFAQAECDETFVHLEFLYETGSAKGDTIKTLLAEYNILSKRINKYIQWVENNFDPNNMIHEPDAEYLTWRAAAWQLEPGIRQPEKPAPGNRHPATETLFEH